MNIAGVVPFNRCSNIDRWEIIESSDGTIALGGRRVWVDRLFHDCSCPKCIERCAEQCAPCANQLERWGMPA